MLTKTLICRRSVATLYDTFLVRRTQTNFGPSVQLDLESRTSCRQTSDSRICHAAVSDVFIWSLGPKLHVNFSFVCALELLLLFTGTCLHFRNAAKVEFSIDQCRMMLSYKKPLTSARCKFFPKLFPNLCLVCPLSSTHTKR